MTIALASTIRSVPCALRRLRMGVDWASLFVQLACHMQLCRGTGEWGRLCLDIRNRHGIARASGTVPSPVAKPPHLTISREQDGDPSWAETKELCHCQQLLPSRVVLDRGCISLPAS